MIPARIFFACEQLRDVGLRGGQGWWEVGEEAFANCWKLCDVDVPPACV
jgi:hypothetical protein